MKKSALFNLSSGIIAVISVFMLTCSNSNPSSGGGAASCDKPAAPANVKAEAVSTSAIRLTWNPVADVDLYTVYRSAAPDGEFSSVGKVLDASFKDSALAQATAYYYKVAAKNDCGEGARSTLATATTMSCSKPATPTNVKAEALSATSIKVSWDSIPTAAVYVVYRAAGVDETYYRIDSTINKTYTNTGLQISSTHYYKIVAKSDCGESERSNYASATTNACPKPEAPANVAAEAKSSSSITVTWDEVNTAITYKIYRSTTSAGTYSPVGNTAGKTSTAWTDDGLEMAKDYYYKIVAESECEESAMSNYALATTTNCENKPAAPTTVTAEALSSTEIKVSWGAVSGAKTYSIYIKSEDSSIDYYLAVSRVTNTTYTVNGRTPARTYYFKVVAVNDCGESAMSATAATATTLDCNLPILPAPTGVTATALSARSVRITWNAVSGAVYDIYRTTDIQDSWWTVSGARNLTATSFIDTTLSSSTTYYYAVKSVNSCGKSDNISAGDVVTVVTRCETPIPTNVTVTAKSSSSLEVKWDAISDAVSYSVYRAARDPNGQYELRGKISGASSAYTDTGLESLTSYFYKVTAKTELCDDSRQSTFASGTTQ